MGSDKYVFFDFKEDSYGTLAFGGIFVSPETLGYLSQVSSYVLTTGDSPTPVRYRPGNPFFEIYGRVYRLLHGNIWIGHDISKSDIPRLIAACEEIGKAPPEPKYVIDTLDFLKSDTKLARLAARFGFGDPKHGSYKACEMNFNAIKQSWDAMSLLCEQEDKEKNSVDKIHPILSLFLKSDTTRRFSELDIGRCLRNGNPEALYRKGVYNYFDIGKNVLCLDDEEGDKGRACLAKASKKGNKKARYVYGMVCIVQGATKVEGLKVLSSLFKPMLSTTMEEMHQLRKNVRDEIEWGGNRRMRELKESYTYRGCICNGGTKKFLKGNCAWNGYGINEDISTSSASFCEICFWDYEIGY